MSKEIAEQLKKIDKRIVRIETWYNENVGPLNRIINALLDTGIVSNGWCAEKAGMTLQQWRKRRIEWCNIDND